MNRARVEVRDDPISDISENFCGDNRTVGRKLFDWPDGLNPWTIQRGIQSNTEIPDLDKSLRWEVGAKLDNNIIIEIERQTDNRLNSEVSRELVYWNNPVIRRRAFTSAINIALAYWFNDVS